MPTQDRRVSHRPRSAPALALLALGCLGAGLVSSPRSAHAGGPHAEVEGQIDKGKIREVVRAHIDEVRHCYNTELVEQPELAGRTVIAFTIGAEGQVLERDVTESTMPPRFDGCLEDAVAGWRFPAPKDSGKVSVHYPFLLEPE